jgi:hypothetical protein
MDWSQIRVPDGYHPSVTGSITSLSNAAPCDVCQRPVHTSIRFDCEGKPSLSVCGQCYNAYLVRYRD